MPMNRSFLAVFVSLFSVWLRPMPVRAADVPAVRAGWKVELVARTPEIKHPSVVCTAPDGRIFVAEDPMDIREDTPPDAKKGRIVCLHPDGRRTIFAEGLQAVYGLQYLEGKLYVLHNPQLTVFRDEQGVGQDARDILTHTLKEPWALGWNDHIPANFKLGMDGWFYLSVGDKGLLGCTGTDGRKIDLPGGGIARFRPDGSQLEVFSTGVRNILDVALNAEDEMFTYDNTDEHQWMGRLTHMVEAGEYGYPHDFIPRRPYTLWMMHDFGAGAACGTLCNTDDALPAAMSGNLFLADFGKRQVAQVQIERDGATWRMAGAQDLFPNPPDDFRPVGLGWAPDGRSFYVCDWQFRDQKVNRDLGRLWKVTWVGDSAAPPRPHWWIPLASGEKREVPPSELLAALAHPAQSVRLTAQRALAANGNDATKDALRNLLVSAASPPLARRHALWTLDSIDGGVSARQEITALAAGGDDALASQAFRQLSQRRVISAGAAAEKGLSARSAPVRFQAATAVGRLGYSAAAASVIARLGVEEDAVVRYALFTALRRLGEADASVWPLVVQGIEALDARTREGCRFALRNVWSERLVPLLAERVHNQTLAVELLADTVFQPNPWRGEWGAYHPAKQPPPARTVRWAGTDAAHAALRLALAQSQQEESRRRAAQALAADSNSTPALREALAHDAADSVRIAALSSLVALKDGEVSGLVAHLLGDGGASEPLRLACIGHAASVQPPPVEALKKLLSPGTPAALRLAAIPALGQLKAAREPLREPLRELLRTGTGAEKLATVQALARFADHELTPDFLEARKNAELTRGALLALAAAPDVRATPAYLNGLADSDPGAAQASREALGKLGATAIPAIVPLAESLPPTVRGMLRDVFKDDAEALKHPLFTQLQTTSPEAYEKHAAAHPGDPVQGQAIFFGAAGTACIACHQVAGFGVALGPDLTLAGKQFSRKEIVESILYPSRVVREGYQQFAVKTTDGREVVGSMKADTGEGITLADLAGQTTLIPRVQVADRHALNISLMPEGLHAGLTPEQFSDLVAYVASRRSDPRTEPVPPLPSGFAPLFNGHDLAGWRMTDINRRHWKVIEGRIEHDGVEGDLWSEREFGDFTLHLEWRWPGQPTLTDLPIITAEGKETKEMARVLDAGDSGVFLRGWRKAQANLFCYPVGSGEFCEYREDKAQTPDFARRVTPKKRADAPVGDWNVMQIAVQADRVTVVLNGEEVISQVALSDLPARGPIGFQHEHGRIQFRTVAVKELSPK